MSIIKSFSKFFNTLDEDCTKSETRLMDIHRHSNESEKIAIDKVFIALCGVTLTKLIFDNEGKD